MIIYLSNALDEMTKNKRLITTDSPAATKKVFGICHALKTVGIHSQILSMGRGRQNRSWKIFHSSSEDIDGIHIKYASFYHIPFFTHTVTAISLMLMMIGLIRKKRPIVLVYNRCWHYIPALCVAKLCQIYCFLDLEDGWVGNKTFLQKHLVLFFDWVCFSGSLLASNALKEQVKTVNNFTCYGAIDVPFHTKKEWRKGKLQVLFGGSLWQGTGADLFIDGLRILVDKYPEVCEALHVVVVGFGDLAEKVNVFSQNETQGLVEFRGNVSDDEYYQLLSESHIGLCLKLSGGSLHDSTFPSKVIELTANGLLLITTKVSDVPNLFLPNAALFVANDDAKSLADLLFWAVTHRVEAEKIAEEGKKVVVKYCSAKKVGEDLAKFFGAA